MPDPYPNDIAKVLEESIQNYINSRSAKIPEFVDRCFSRKGAFELHRNSFRLDLAKSALNVLWTVPLLTIRSLVPWFDRVGFERGIKWVKALPEGFSTNVQRELEWKIATELLEIPFEQAGRKHENDALAQTILRHPRIAALGTFVEKDFATISSDTHLQAKLRTLLGEYVTRRNAIGELAGSGVAFLIGYFIFQQKSFDAVSIGNAAAKAFAKKKAASDFFLGDTAGGVFYNLFPPTPSQELVWGVTLAVMCTLAIITSLAGLVTDPLQARTGIQRIQLSRIVNALALELQDRNKYAFLAMKHLRDRNNQAASLYKQAAG